ncbi:MAG: hypothetical protein IPK10_19905 [Bacteroidetes bacterium]|nr:hypothetical protein [Bacteroidota bacterium]
MIQLQGVSFLEDSAKYNLKTYLALLNTKLISYILNCLNATVATNSDDIHRVPLVKIESIIEDTIIALCNECVKIKMDINRYSIIEKDFDK